jgi:hypothetical protein
VSALFLARELALRYSGGGDVGPTGEAFRLDFDHRLLLEIFAARRITSDKIGAHGRSVTFPDGRSCGVAEDVVDILSLIGGLRAAARTRMSGDRGEAQAGFGSVP